MSESIDERLQDVFRDVFGQRDLILRDELTAADVKGWDSLKHVELIMCIEQTFGVRFKTAEIATLENVGALASKLRQKLSR
jgi:acyl carrier protein